jgi:anthranilate synthase component 2
VPASGGPDVVVVDHHDSYTWNLVHLVAEVTGVLPTVVQHDEVTAVEVLAHTHVVLSPGPGTPEDAADFSVGREVLLDSVGRVEPAHGEVAQVRHDGRGVFAGVPQEFAAVRYHSLAALALPEVLVATAWTGGTGGSGASGGVVMGVRHRHLPLEGVQFHPESILTDHGARIVANFLGATR